jgi:hypothetical protein
MTAARTGDDEAIVTERDQFIPARKSDILNALAADGHLRTAEEREQFGQVCRLLGAVYHYEYFDRLERLRDAYFYFNPELETLPRIERTALDRAYADMVDMLTAVLKGANFVELSHDEIAHAHRQRALIRVEIKAPLEDFRDVRIFRRGRHSETIDVTRWYHPRKRTIEADIYDDVVLLVAMKPETELAPKRDRRRLSKRRIRPGSVLLKYFRRIARADVHALFPNVRVVMSTFDKLVLGVPALAGGLPILFNLASSITVLFVVIGFYLGISGAVEEDHVKQALAAMSGLVALGGFVMRQWVKYQRQSLKYQKELTDNIYFRNINNNAGIFDYIIGAAEEQECKETFLAYYFLHTVGATTQAELDARIEAWLKQALGLDMDFEVEDALAKLERLGLLTRSGARLSVPPLSEALVILDRAWDGYFRYEPAPAV